MTLTTDKARPRRWRIVDNAYLLLAFASLCWSGNHILGRAIEGKVNERTVWIRVEQEPDPKITSVTVQARTKWGGSDIELVHQLSKEIYAKLAK